MAMKTDCSVAPGGAVGKQHTGGIMTCRQHVAAVFIFVLSVFAASTCLADEGNKPGPYVQGGVALYALEVPNYAPLAAFSTNPLRDETRVTLRDDTAMGGMGRLTMGWRTATPLFFELSGRFFETTDHRGDAFTGAQFGTTYVGFFSPSGIKVLMATNGTAYTDLRSLFREAGGRLLAGYALDLGENVTLSPLLGFELMRIDQQYDLDYHTSTGGVMDLNEDVGAVYQGPVAGLRFAAELGQWRGTLEGFAAWYRVESGYEADMITNNYVDYHSLQSVDYATGLEIAAALDRRLGSWLIGLKGGYRHLSHVPQIVASGLSQATVVSAFDSRPTYLSGDESQAYSLELRLGYSF